jgi:hypothetical protein
MIHQVASSWIHSIEVTDDLARVGAVVVRITFKDEQGPYFRGRYPSLTQRDVDRILKSGSPGRTFRAFYMGVPYITEWEIR